MQRKRQYIKINRHWFKYTGYLKGSLLCGRLCLAAYLKVEAIKCRDLKSALQGRWGWVQPKSWYLLCANLGKWTYSQFCHSEWRDLLHSIVGWWETGYEALGARHTVRAQLVKVISLLSWLVLFFTPLPKGGEGLVKGNRVNQFSSRLKETFLLNPRRLSMDKLALLLAKLTKVFAVIISWTSQYNLNSTALVFHA